MTLDRGNHWTRITGNQFDRVTSLTFNPQNLNQAYLTTETQGLWVSQNMQATVPTWDLVESYSFRQPERVFFNPFNQNEMWVTSFGNGLKTGVMNPTSVTEIQSTVYDFSVYPNPFNEKISISSKKANEPVHIVNLIGKEIYTCTLKQGINEINTRQWPAGVFIIRIMEKSVKVMKY